MAKETKFLGNFDSVTVMPAYAGALQRAEADEARRLKFDRQQRSSKRGRHPRNYCECGKPIWDDSHECGKCEFERIERETEFDSSIRRNDNIVDMMRRIEVLEAKVKELEAKQC